MLRNKRAGYATPMIALPALFMLFLVLTFFMLYFFVLGGARASEIVISSKELPPVQKLPGLLGTVEPVSGKTYSSLLADAYFNENEAEKFRYPFASLLDKILIPTQNQGTAGWNLRVYTLKEMKPVEYLDINNIVLPGKSSSIEYFNEFLIFPLPENPDSPLMLELYLSCLACSDEYLGGYA